MKRLIDYILDLCKVSFELCFVSVYFVILCIVLAPLLFLRFIRVIEPYIFPGDIDITLQYLDFWFKNIQLLFIRFMTKLLGIR